jgi:hypothetical protein
MRAFLMQAEDELDRRIEAVRPAVKRAKEVRSIRDSTEVPVRESVRPLGVQTSRRLAGRAGGTPAPQPRSPDRAWARDLGAVARRPETPATPARAASHVGWRGRAGDSRRAPGSPAAGPLGPDNRFPRDRLDPPGVSRPHRVRNRPGPAPDAAATDPPRANAPGTCGPMGVRKKSEIAIEFLFDAGSVSSVFSQSINHRWSNVLSPRAASRPAADTACLPSVGHGVLDRGTS